MVSIICLECLDLILDTITPGGCYHAPLNENESYHWRRQCFRMCFEGILDNGGVLGRQSPRVQYQRSLYRITPSEVEFADVLMPPADPGLTIVVTVSCASAR